MARLGVPRTCSVCNHRSRQAIEEGLLAGEAFRNIAKRFGMSPTALFRHKSEHLLQSLQASQAAGEVLRADALVDHVRQLRARTEALYADAESILTQARRAKDLKTCLDAIRSAAGLIRETRGNAELLGRLTGELQNVAVQAEVRIVVPLLPAAAADADVAVPIVLCRPR